MLVPTAASAAASSAPTGHASLAGQRILLVNDDSVQGRAPDGSDGRGMYLLRDELCRAGADVVVVGPWSQQSGRSRATSGARTVRATPVAPPRGFGADCGTAPSRGLVLGVCQGGAACTPDSESVTPADAVDLALGALLRDRIGWSRPDLAVSGTNAGANTDAAVNLSGTVGAATAAIEHGVPAIAVSAGSRATSVPNTATYETAARYVVGLLARLSAVRLPEHLAARQVLLNVNVPDVQPGAGLPPASPTRVGTHAPDRFSYSANGAGGYDLRFGAVRPAPAIEPGSDTAALGSGRISVGAVAVNRTATTSVRQTLSSLTRYR